MIAETRTVASHEIQASDGDLNLPGSMAEIYRPVQYLGFAFAVIQMLSVLKFI